MGNNQSGTPSEQPAPPSLSAPTSTVTVSDAAASDADRKQGADARGRYRQASPEAIAYRDATNINANKAVKPQQREVTMADTRRYVIEQEGLLLGDERREKLAQQWRFAVASEPFQRGLDAGLIFSAVTVGYCLGIKKTMRQKPGQVAFRAILAFCAGVLVVPAFTIYLDERNESRIRARDAAMMQRQRDDFLKGGDGK